MEYRALQDPATATGDLHALRFNGGNVRLLWRAAEQLRRLSPNERVILTYDPAIGGIPFRHDHLNTNQRIVLDEAELDWLRGLGNAKRLGPILRSRPVFVGVAQAVRRDQRPYPTASHDAYAAFARTVQGRSALVYVGANDGMLHGFDAVTGDEVFAYVPNKLIDGGQRFATRLDLRVAAPARTHALVDLTPTVEDVFVRSAAQAERKVWRTVLIGGLGAGGKGYFALDITDPDRNFRSESEAAGAVLWEFTDADDFHPADADGNALTGADGLEMRDDQGAPIKDLGYALSQARIAMSNARDADGQRHWTALFGNGPESTAGRAVLFILFIDRGMDSWGPEDLVKLSSNPAWAPGQQNGLGEPALVDLDLNGTVDRAYAGDLLGNLLRFDLSSPDPTQWTASVLFRAASRDGVAQPIAVRPQVFEQPGQPGFMIVFGTGRCSYADAAGDGAAQSLFGIRDLGLSEVPVAKVARHQITNIEGGGDAAFATWRIVFEDAAGQPPHGQTALGWRLDFDADAPRHAGECVSRRLMAWGGLLFVTTALPGGEGGALLPFDPSTGLSPRYPILDLNGDGRVDEEDLATMAGDSYAPGILFERHDLGGPLLGPQILHQDDGALLVLAGGHERRVLALGAPLRTGTGRLSWRELTDLE